MTLQVRAERWMDFCFEAEPLFRLHHEEVGEHDLAFELDHQRIVETEAAGGVKFWVARCHNRVVGYICWYLSYHLFCRGLLVASMGPWFVEPQHRHSAIAMRLWALAKQELKGQGVQVMLPHHQYQRGFELDTMFKRQGAEPYEMSYFLRLQSGETAR